MKKLLSIILAVSMLVGLFPASLGSFMTFATNETIEVYVSADGNDTNEGTAESPFKTIAGAIENVGADCDFTIYVMGANYPFGEDIPHIGTVTIKPADSTATLSGGKIKINGPTKIHVNTANAGAFYPNGYDFELDGTVNKSVANEVFVGNSEGRPNRVALNGQYIKYLVCFDDNDNGKSDTLITVDGATIFIVCPTPKTKGATGTMGNLRMVVNSGEVQIANLYEEPANTATDSGMVFVFNNNEYNTKFVYNKIQREHFVDWASGKVWFKGGEMFWSSTDTDGNYLIPNSMTNFDVVGTKTAYYQSEDKKTVYYSKDGKINLPVLSANTKKEDAATVAEILWTDNFSTDILEAPPTYGEREFLNWEDDGNGKIVARYSPPKNHTYYVKAGGTGDGSSYSSPAPNLAAVVEKINSDGHDETTGEVNVYIIESGEPSEVDTVVQRADLSKYVTLNLTVPHSAKINFTTYDYENTGKPAVIYSHTDILPYSNAGTFVGLGNVSYKNVIYVDTRSDWPTGFYLQGYDFEFENFIYRRLNIDKPYIDQNGDGKVNSTDYKLYHQASTEATIKDEAVVEINSYILREGEVKYGTGGRVILDNKTYFSNLRFGGYFDNIDGNTVPGDQIIELRGVKDKAVDFANCGTDKTYTYNGDVSLVLNGSTGITFNSTSPAVISGAVQVLLNSGSNFTPSFMSSASAANGGKVPYYVMNSGNEAGTLDVTDEAGVYTVNANGLYAYAYKESGKEVYYGNEILKVKEDGEYTVKYVSKVSDIISALSDSVTNDPATGMVFKGWKDDGNGTLTAVIEQKTPETKNYYVKYGGTGDGRSETNPAATVSDVVKSVNEDLIFGDTAVINIMNYGNPVEDNMGKTSVKGNLVEGTFTSWSKNGGPLAENHYAILRITSYDPDPDDGVAPEHTYLAYSSRIGADDVMVLTGTVIFDNITVLRPRTYDRELYLNGHNATFTESVRFGHFMANYSSGKAFTGIEFTDNHIALGYGAVIEKDQVVHIDSPVSSQYNNNGISLSGTANSDFNGNVSLYLNNKDINSLFSWGIASRTSNFNKGLNLIVDAIGEINYPTGNYALGKVNVSGGFQIINNNGYKFPELPENVTYDELWIVNSAKGYRLDVTDKAGTFRVPDGKYAFVQKDNNKTIFYGTGTITLPAGTYDVKFADSKEAILTLATKPADVDNYTKFHKFVDDGNGKMTAEYKYELPTYYVSTSGSDSNDGSSEEKAFKTTAKAIEVIEASGLYGLIMIKGNVELKLIPHTQKVFFESLSGGTLHGSNNEISLLGPVVIKADFAAAQTIFTNGYELELSGKVDMGQQNIVYAGNRNNTNGTDENITLSGKYIHKLVTHVAEQYAGDINIRINGAVVRQVITGPNDLEEGAYQVHSVRITLDSGELWSYSHADNSAHKAKGTFEFIANGNNYYFEDGRNLDGNTITSWYDDSVNGADGFVKVQYDAGKYVVRSADKENSLSCTGTAGVYAYSGTKTPYFISETGLTVRYGVDGRISLTTGAVDVLWTDKFSIDDIGTPTVPEGFEFIGWTDDGKGTITANVISPNSYYVDATNGLDTNTGDQSSPFKTIAKAVESFKGKTGFVYVSGTATYDVKNAHSGLITIKGTTPATSTINFTGDTALAGNTKLANIKLTAESISTNGNNLEIGENVTCSGLNIETGSISGIKEKIVISGVNASVKIGADGGIASTTVYAKDATLSLSLGDTYSYSAIKVTLDDSKLSSLDVEGKEFESLEIITNGNTSDIDVTAENVRIINNSATNAFVDLTEQNGVYGVKAPYGKTPIAIGEDGKIYVADNYTSQDIAPETWYERNQFDKFINYRKPLNNTYKKLTEDKELKVVYYGGSMTNGSGMGGNFEKSWRVLTGKWIAENFPDATITNVNRALGESGSYLGVHRMQLDIIPTKPDLMFFEYSINDRYFGTSYEETCIQVETVLRELKTALPETDIVFVLVTDKGCLTEYNIHGNLHPQAQAHEDMAAKYGYSTLEVGMRLAEYVNYDPDIFATIAADSVHLKESGYKLYYDVIEEFMYNSLFCTDYEGLRERNEELLPVQSAHLMDGNRTQHQATAELLAKSEALGGTGVTRVDGLYSETSETRGKFVLDSTDDVFAFEFDGTDAAFWSNYYNKHQFLVSIDGGAYVNTYGSSHAPARIVNGLTSGKHLVKIKIVDASVPLEIGSIFTIDTTKATLKGATHTYTDYTNRTFALPSGNYDIQYVQGKTIGSLPAYKGDGVFQGWVNENGESYSSNTLLVPGMVIIPSVGDKYLLEEDFESASDCSFLAPGDMNADGKVNTDDLVLLKRLLLTNITDSTYTSVYRERGEAAKYSDVNGDGFVNVKDLVRMKKNLAENAVFVADGVMALNGNTAFTGAFTSYLAKDSYYEVSLTYKSDSPVIVKIGDLGKEIVFEASPELSTVTKTFKVSENVTDTDGIEFQIIGVASVDKVSVAKVSKENEPIEDCIFVSNLYGSDSNDGKTKANAVKTLKKAIELVGTENDGTICLLDGKDANGNREYEVYTRNSKSPFHYGGTQNVVQYIDIPAHTGTITYIGDASDSVICFGANHMEIQGPSVFKNISLIEGYKLGKSFVTNGHNVTFDSNVYFITTASDNSTDQPANAGLVDPGARDHEIDVAGRNQISSTNPGRITLKNVDVKYVAVGGWDNTVTIANNQTIHICDGANVALVKLRNTSGIWDMQNINVVVDGGNVAQIADSGTGTATAKAVQIVMNNGISVPYTKTGITLTEGEWIMHAAENSKGAKLDVTETAGTFEVIGGLTAVAQNKDGEVYVSQNGILTVPAGEYNVSFHSALGENDILVSFDGEVSDQVYTKGEQITLPKLEDVFGADFVGWSIDGNQYAAGYKYTLPTDKILVGFTSVWDTENASARVYLDTANGSDSNDGYSSATAFATLSKAISTVDSAPGTKKIVVIVGTLKVDSIPAHTNQITFTGGKFYYSDSVAVGGPTKFENIEIYTNVASKFLETREKLIIIGENVVCNNTASETGIPMHIGTLNVDGGRETLEINSGTFGPILVGAYYNTDSKHSTEGADITVNGGTISEIRMGADGWKPGTHLGVIFTDNVNITVNGGSVTKITRSPSSYAPTFDAALQIILNNGVSATVPQSCETANGYWLMKGENKSGSYLKATAKEGEFEVVGPCTAIATDSNGTQYVSASGILTVPAGTYNVTYTDKVYYINNGSEVEFYEDYEVDVENLRHNEVENKLFIGWAYEDGTGVKTNNFKEGEKLYAKYVDCSLSRGGDFAVKGADIRVNENPALRFILEKSDALSNGLGDIEYGAVAIPTEYMGTDTLEIGSVFTYYEKEYQAVDIKATNIFDKTEKGIEYTACITGIAKEHYRRTYTVRGYIKYTDLQGKEKVLYTDTFATSLYTVACDALEEGNVTDVEKAYLESIKTYVDEDLKSQYFSQAKKDIHGTSADLTTWMYQLGDGVMVREVVVDSGTGGDAVEIGVISDTHFSYCNEEDLKDPVLASNWEVRNYFKYPTTQEPILNSIEFAGFMDQIVLTGDAIDYLAKGSIDLLNRFLWDIYPETLIPLGNHEPEKKMTGKVPNTTTLEQRYAELQTYWKHDIYYTEKIMKNDNGTEKVMLIQIDNDREHFWDHEIPLLEASIAKARQKNIPILMFAHVPLNTRNPEDTAVPAIHSNEYGVNSENFVNHPQFIGNRDTDTDADKAIYDLITMNADIIKGFYAGHWHVEFYTEILGKNADGTDNTDLVIPQYVVTTSTGDKGHALRITVK